MDAAAVAGDVSRRFEHWFQAHRLALPPETQAEFIEMGMEAVLQHPERPRGEVLDELIAELDQRLGHIVTEATDQQDRAPAQPPGARRGWLRRLLGRGD
jgi:hypothetical protein